MKIPLILAWVLWSLLLLAWPADLAIALLSSAPETLPPPINPSALVTLTATALATLALTFVARWFLLRFLIHPDRISPDSAWAGILYFIAAFLIWSMTKSVETYGFILFFQTRHFPLYVAFWIPSLMVFLIHLPHCLKPKEGTP